MALGKRAWRWEKGAWHGAMLKGAGGNTKRTVNKPELFYILYYVQSRVTPKKQVAGANSSREN